MRWPWQRSRRGPADNLPPRVATWVQPALPPTPVASPTEASRPRAGDGGVRLGFSDGSLVDLPAGDPHALALRAVAGLLMDDDR